MVVVWYLGIGDETRGKVEYSTKHVPYLIFEEGNTESKMKCYGAIKEQPCSVL